MAFTGANAEQMLTRAAYDYVNNPRGAELQAIFASDIGHWDVQDFRDVLPEAWELVEHGALDEAQFRSFTFDNVASLMTATNPDFFKGTVVEDAVKQSPAD